MSPLTAHKLLTLWIAALATGFLLLLATPAHGLGLAWNGFRNATGVDAIDLACTTGGTHELVVDFEVLEPFENLSVLEVRLTLGGFVGGNDPVPPLPAFWHFETGGCNENGSYGTLIMPADAAGRQNPWGLGGGAAQMFVQYAPDYPSVGRGQFIVSIARWTPITLVPGQRYFAFRLVLNTCDADACGGCDLSGGVEASSAILTNTDGQSLYLDGHVPADDPLVCMNTGGWCGVINARDPIADVEAGRSPAGDAAFKPVNQVETLCAPVPVRERTWGAVKTLYR